MHKVKKYQSDSESNSEDYIIEKHKNKRKKYKKVNLKIISLSEYETKEIFENNNINKIPIIKTLKMKNLTIKTKYLYKVKLRNSSTPKLIKFFKNIFFNFKKHEYFELPKNL